MPGILHPEDKEQAPSGSTWEKEIGEAIRSSRFFLLLLSQKSTTKKGFYQKEIRLALEVLDEFPDSQIFLIPVRLDGCEPHVARLNSIQRVDLFPDWESGIASILRTIEFHGTAQLPSSHDEQTSETGISQLQEENRLLRGQLVRLTSGDKQPADLEVIRAVKLTVYSSSVDHARADRIEAYLKTLGVAVERTEWWTETLDFDVQNVLYYYKAARADAASKLQTALLPVEFVRIFEYTGMDPRGAGYFNLHIA